MLDKWIEEKIKTHDKRLDSHSQQLDELNAFRSSTTVELRNLVEQIKSLVSAIKWVMTFAITLLAGFFIWYIQNL